MTFDLRITNGVIVDGTGSPSRPGDVAVADGRIIEVGAGIEGSARRVIDAGGAAVAPGFIDIHTHLDAQVLWDPMASVSSWHGVTTVIAGNCGFGFAPTRAHHRELVMRMLENVEGMDIDCLTEGLGTWGFETFPEYLAAVEARGTAVNFGGLMPHSNLRLYVMGEEASTRAATTAEVAEMATMLRDALRVGAVGFSTSRHIGHSGAGGKPVPSRLADEDELNRFAEVMAEEGRGVLMAAIGKGFTVPQLRDLATRSGRPVTYASLIVGMAGADGHRRLLERTEEAQAEGFEIVPQVSCLPVTVEFTLQNPFFLAESMPAAIAERVLTAEFAAVTAEASLASRLAVYASSSFRDAFRDATSSDTWNRRIWQKVFITEAPGLDGVEGAALTEYARARGQHPADALIDVAVATGLEARFSTVLHNSDEDEVEHLLLHPQTQLGLSDAGAHVSQLCDACYPSYLLGHWVRERGSLALEAAVKMLTGDPARLYRLRGRGVLAPGNAADLVVFDPDTVRPGARERRRDLPGNAPRVVIPAQGIDAVVVNGTPIRERGEDTLDGGPLPGRVLGPHDLAG